MRLKYKTQLRKLIRSGVHNESTINVYPTGQWDILKQDCPPYALTVMCIPVHEISRYTNIDDGITIIFDVINTALNQKQGDEMYNKDQYEMLIKGDFEAWDEYRRDNVKVEINLRGADFSDVDLSNVDLSRANLRDADLSRARLRGTDLSCTNLRGANFDDAKF